MKVTVCELPNETQALERSWRELVRHAAERRSDLVLLPEMPFHPWLSHTRQADAGRWEESVRAHAAWISRLPELSPAAALGTRPFSDGRRRNSGFAWDAAGGERRLHDKYYLPDEPGFWEASWYARGEGDFAPFEIAGARAGFLICSEIWFGERARAYGRQGVQILACPRATPRSSADKWVAAGRAAAVVSGAYCLSSNLSGRTPQGGDYAGRGFIVEPEEGEVLGLTSENEPFLTLDLDLRVADKAKTTYPRYIKE